VTLQEIMIYLTRKLNKKQVILTFGQFDQLIILDKLIQHLQLDWWFFLLTIKWFLLLIKLEKTLK
jgi:hypothetical protein